MILARSSVAVYLSQLDAPKCPHEKATLESVAKAIAQLLHYEFAGDCDAGWRLPGHVFYVPDDTLLDDEAVCLGIRSESDFFGGAVPDTFVKIKVVSPPLVTSTATRPQGWSAAFAERVRSADLPGHTVFSIEDAREAARRLLLPPIRFKKPLASGGKAQNVARTINEVERYLEGIPPHELSQDGLVLEINLSPLATISVGKVTVGRFTTAYYGTQRRVKDNHGRLIYGGSNLVCVREGWSELEGIQLPAEARLAIAQARAYDDAMSEYPGFMASRRNYDVGQGIDGQGQRRSGVFEASWRSGGASTAELAALTEFAANRELEIIHVSTVREFGAGRNAPPGADIHYCGNDPRDGPILRYTATHP
jgi:hypothetical protein